LFFIGGCMDATISRVIEEISKELNLDSGFLIRIINIEEAKAHLSRRHGIFEELRELSRKAGQRELDNSGLGENNEDQKP
jgi:hypothetical protein